jgi:hypothetical protein
LKILKAIGVTLGIAACFYSLGCGTTEVETVTAPSISAVLPQTIAAGSSSVTMKVVGTNFTANAVILWNGGKLATSVVDANTLSGSIQGGSLAVPGTAQVQVQNSQTGQASQSVPISIISSNTTVPLPLAISVPTVPVGVVGTSYSVGFSATGGAPAYTWSLTSGSLPAGMSVAANTGVISGTPTASGTYSFTVTVTDSSSPVQTQSASLSITIAPPAPVSSPQLTISNSALPAGTDGLAYSQTLQAAGGSPAYKWSLTVGSLPAGLTLAAGSGVISGVPTTSGTFTFTAEVTDSSDPAQVKSVPLSITIASSQLTITSSALAPGTPGAAYSQTLRAAGGTPAYTWSITSGSLPAGLTLAAGSGVISGTPTTSGTFFFTAKVTDRGSPVQAKSVSLSITVTSSQLSITSSALASGTEGSAYSQTLHATGGTPSYSWSVTSGSLPTGITIAAGSGVISGTPTESGTFSFTAMVTDTSSPVQSKSVALSITIASNQLTIATSSLAAAAEGTSYSQTLRATGGTPGYLWSITNGNLPAGMSLAAGSGLISGTPTTSGTFTFTVTVSDSGNPVQTHSTAMSILIAAPSLTITSAALPSATDGTAYSQTLNAIGGTPEYTWAVTLGSLPAGLTLAGTTGTISGTPTASGIFTFTVTVSDSGTPAQTKSAVLSLTLAPQPSGAGTTWYIRLDGGNNTQCTGTVNAAYPGTGVNQPCAYNHPYQMLTYSGNWASMQGGDTIQFEDQGPYFMGQENQGVGTDWSTQLGTGICPTSGAAGSCILPIPPSGTPGHPTQIIGANAGSCHNSTHTGLVNPTVLSGINDAYGVLRLTGTNYVTISCIEVTQPDTCTVAGAGAGGGCVAGTNNFVGGSGGGGIIFENGAVQGPSNLTMQDVAVIGIASSGILGSHVNTLSTDVLTASDIYIIGNGQAGWNGDGGGCGNNCESIGTMNLSYMTVDWNGCVAVKPYLDSLGSTGNAYNYCYDDSTNGYGDGFVMIAANNVTLNVTHSKFRWNTQDGFDSLHLSDDLTHSPSVSIFDSWSEGNEGQTFKLGAGTTATANNNVSISNCRVLGTASNFPLNPAGWNAGVSDMCRAAGDQWAFQLGNSTTVILANNTSVGYGTTMYDFEPASGASPTTGTKLIFENNISKGYLDTTTGVQAAGLYFGIPDPLHNPGSSASHNLWDTMKTSGCLQDAAETNCLYTDPLLIGESNINAINPNLTSASPAIGAGVVISGITTDYDGLTRPSSPALGAFEP